MLEPVGSSSVETPTKLVSLAGIKSSNSFRQNLRKARSVAKSSKEKRTRKKKIRSKIRLHNITRKGNKIHTNPKDVKQTPKVSSHIQPAKVIQNELTSVGNKRQSLTKKRVRQINTPEQLSGIVEKPVIASQTKKGILNVHNKTHKKDRKVRWLDQETGSSLASYRDAYAGKSFSEDTKLFNETPGMRLHHTRKRSRDDDEDERECDSDDTFGTIKMVVCPLNDDTTTEDVIGDIVDIDEPTTSERLRSKGIIHNNKSPPDLIHRLLQLSDEFGGTIQTVE